jgi:hypothetical protein
MELMESNGMWEEGKMRWLFGFLAIVLVGLAVSPVVAKTVYPKKGYGSCYCDYGYAGLACVPVVSCYDEGGRCKKACRRQSE